CKADRQELFDAAAEYVENKRNDSWGSLWGRQGEERTETIALAEANMEGSAPKAFAEGFLGKAASTVKSLFGLAGSIVKADANSRIATDFMLDVDADMRQAATESLHEQIETLSSTAGAAWDGLFSNPRVLIGFMSRQELESLGVAYRAGDYEQIQYLNGGQGFGAAFVAAPFAGTAVKAGTTVVKAGATAATRALLGDAVYLLEQTGLRDAAWGATSADIVGRVATVNEIVGAVAAETAARGALADTQAALTQQVADLRAMLTGAAKTGGNMGVAQIDIPSVQSTMAASSRIVAPTAEQQALGFVGKVSETFPSTEVLTTGNNPILLLRNVDSEAKILNNIAAQLGENTSISGTVSLLTERAPCASCSNIIQQFQAKYPNIKVNIMENGGVIPPTKKGP
ncbi:MAG: hypothetical protein LBI92_03040, partial [Azoarcus sp.]|nr:hypothetical protein [Azoarcus sp.]